MEHKLHLQLHLGTNCEIICLFDFFVNICLFCGVFLQVGCGSAYLPVDLAEQSHLHFADSLLSHPDY